MFPLPARGAKTIDVYYVSGGFFALNGFAMVECKVELDMYISALQTSCDRVHSLLHHPTLQHLKYLRWTVRLYDRRCKLIEQRVFHVIRAMGTDAEWREQFMNIGKKPWEIEREPVPDEPEQGVDPTPNTGNNWHSGGTAAPDSLAADRARNVSAGREGRSISSNTRRPVVHLLPHVNLDDLYIKHPSDFSLRFDALYREYLKSMASPEMCTLVDIMKNHIRFKQEMTRLLGCEMLFIAASPYYDPLFFPQDLLKGSFQTGDLRPLVDHYWTTTRQIPVKSFTEGENSTELSRVRRFVSL